MGLDMYLYLEKEEYKSPYTTSPKDTDLTLEYPEVMKGVEKNLERIGVSQSVTRKTTYLAGYWRKANAIHQWFVDNCADGEDDCRPMYCSLEQLQELLTKCIKIKMTPESAGEELPTQEGFFFGSTDYGEWYYKQIDATISILENVIAVMESDDNVRAVYEASW